MALTVGNLDSYFVNLVNDVMAVERQPLTRLQKSRDQVSVQRGVYTDLNGKLQSLQDAVKALRDTSTTGLSVGRKAVVSNIAAGSVVLTASAEASAAAGTYQFSVTQLAREHRAWSERQATADQALGLAGTFSLNGVAIEVGAADSLNAIAAAINGKTYAAGQAVTASVVDRRLVIAAQTSGTGASITADEVAGTVLQTLGVMALDQGQLEFVDANQQTARDAIFKVDGVEVTRSQNTGLTDVVAGLTLNLAPDAEGKTATLTVSPDTAAARAAVDKFLSEFNGVQEYLASKTSVTSTTQNGVTTYTRGDLANDNIFGDLRGDLFARFLADGPAGGQYANLRAVGVTLDDNLKATVSDGETLEAALSTLPEAVQSMLEGVMAGVDGLLNNFTGATSGYMKTSLQSLENQISEADTAIADLNVRLAERQQSLIDQFGEMQAMLLEMSYRQQQWSSIYGTYSQLG
jgi:flagellar hook-associated protein 2